MDPGSGRGMMQSKDCASATAAPCSIEDSEHLSELEQYTHPAFHELDLRSVFTDNWIAVGSTLYLRKPGDYITGHIGKHPYIVIRDSEGTIRAYYNVCRHHAMRLLTHECGHVNKIVCGYHGWEYQLDGRLSKATRISGIKNFKARNHGLKEIKAQVWGPLVFLLLGSDPARGRGSVPGQPGLTELKHLLDHHGFSEGLHYVCRRSYTLQCNWKVVVDNYDDGGYHVPYAHIGLGTNLDLESYRTTLHDGYSLQTCGGAQGSGANQRVGRAAVYAHVYPNLMLNRYGPWCDVNAVFPVAHDRCEVVFDYFLEEDFVSKQSKEDLEKFVSDSLEASDKVQQEDTMLCESVQKGLESAGYDVGRYAPKVELADHEFHIRIAKELTAAVERVEEQEIA